MLFSHIFPRAVKLFVCCKVDGGKFQCGRLLQQYHLGFAESLEMEKQQYGFRWMRKMIAICNLSV